MSRIAPGATIGILGGGQLGNMILREAQRNGYRVHVLDPDPDAPAGRRADRFVPAAFDDGDALEDLARRCDVVTLEIEHVPSPGLDRIERIVPVRPRPGILGIVQDRAEQRAFLAKNGFPQPVNRVVSSPDDIRSALGATGTPAVLKTRRGGYDGRGQARVGHADQAEDAWQEAGAQPAVMEAFVPFEKEISVVLARGVDGETQAFPVGENVHVDGVLHTTRVPARLDQALALQAVELATGIAQALDHVGVMAVEMFVTGDGGLLVNEIAPRIHNSGHFTEAACSPSQGEQHLRAVTGYPLVKPVLHRAAVMVNVLGDAWGDGPPDWSPVLEEPDARLHLYGKREARPGRKMGHFIVLGDDAGKAYDRALSIYARLMPQGAQAEARANA